MCGIAGLIGSGGAISNASLRGMAAAIRHRGPDDEGYVTLALDGRIVEWSGDETDPSLGFPPLPREETGALVALAHRRLSILDLSAAGHQPMASSDGRYWIVFNGEIYNYLELRSQLASEGCDFVTHTDTEVLLAGFARYGEAILPRLRGMFAFAVLDRTTRTVTLARDPFGIKPLYYTRTQKGMLGFASEIKALLALPEVPRAMHAPAVFEFLRFGTSDSGDTTMFSGISQLQPGHWMRVTADGATLVAPTRYWRLPDRTPELVRMGDAAEALRDALTTSVRLHMRSDVPVGSCLSGGLDSTAITALAAPLMPRGARFSTVSFISPDPAMTEASFVTLAEQTYAIDSHRVDLSAEGLKTDLEGLVAGQDLPFGSLSIYAQYGVFRAAHAAKLTVMLDGQGSDELLGGYNTAVSAAVAGLLATGRIPSALRLVRAFSPLGARSYSRALLAAGGRFIPPAIAPAFMRAVGEPLVPDWLDGDWFASRRTHIAVRPQGRGRRALSEELRLSTEVLSLPQLLRYEDRNSMAFSIESRVPFCDVGVAEVASRIAPDLLVSCTGETKAALRAATRGLVPDAIIDRPKVGFAAPDQAWLASLAPWLRIVVSEDAARLPFLRRDAFLAEMDATLLTRGYFPPTVWRVLNTILWARAFDIQCD